MDAVDDTDDLGPLVRLAAAADRVEQLGAELDYARALTLVGGPYDPEAFDRLILAYRCATREAKAARQAALEARGAAAARRAHTGAQARSLGSEA